MFKLKGAPRPPAVPVTHLRAFTEELLELALRQKGLGPLAPLLRNSLSGMSDADLEGFVDFASKVLALARDARNKDRLVRGEPAL